MSPVDEIYFDQTGRPHHRGSSDVVHPRVSAYAWVESEGRVLMVKSSWGERWELPGGGIEGDESLVDGMLREVWEESGYAAHVLDSSPSFSTEGRFYMLEESRFYRSFRHYFRCSLVASPEPQAKGIVDGEIVEIAWREMASLREGECHPIHREAIRFFASSGTVTGK